MIFINMRLVATLLAAGAFLSFPGPARAGGGSESPQQAFENSHAMELKLVARRLMVRVEEHRQRITRLENLIRYHRLRNQVDEVRKLEALKQREIEAFEQTLAEIHRLLGSEDFQRVSAAVRYLLHSVQPDAGPAASAELARDPTQASAQTGSLRVQASIERSLDRQIMLERARASSRMQLAQRLKAARDQQLRLIAQQQQRFQRPPEATSARERAANASRGPASTGTQRAAASRRP